MVPNGQAAVFQSNIRLTPGSRERGREIILLRQSIYLSLLCTHLYYSSSTITSSISRGEISEKEKYYYLKVVLTRSHVASNNPRVEIYKDKGAVEMF